MLCTYIPTINSHLKGNKYFFSLGPENLSNHKIMTNLTLKYDLTLATAVAPRRISILVNCSDLPIWKETSNDLSGDESYLINKHFQRTIDNR